MFKKVDDRARYSLTCNSILADIVSALLVVTAATGMFTPYEINALSLAAVQEKKAEASLPLRFENNSQLPAAITEAALYVIESSQVTASTTPATTTDGTKVPENNVAMRQLRFTAKIANQSAQPITHLRLAIENPTALPNQIITILCRIHGKENRLNPNDHFAFSRLITLEEKRYDKELMSHLSDFRVKVIGVSYSMEEDQTWKFSSLPDYDEDGMIVLRSRKDFKDSPQAQYLDNSNRWIYLGTRTIPMGSSVRPTILYKEKASYTREARDNGVQGTVVLNVVFSADGTITNIQVIKGLPDGLTEKAVEAAKKIRFKPALRDGNPVSVRGNLEYSFNLGSR
jgi:TonB family protein